MSAKFQVSFTDFALCTWCDTQYNGHANLMQWVKFADIFLNIITKLLFYDFKLV